MIRSLIAIAICAFVALSILPALDAQLEIVEQRQQQINSAY